MAMKGSFRESGSDEVKEEVCDRCYYCAIQDKIKQATHFCFDCGVFGRYLCASCLQNHNLFVGSHEVTQIGSKSNYRKELKDEIAKERMKSTAAETLAANLKKELTDMNREELRSQNERKELKDEIAKERMKSTAAETLAANLKKELTDMKREELRSQNERKELKDEIAKERMKSTAAETLAANLKKELADTKRDKMRSQNKRDFLLVAAIDIGNYSSGYAFSFKHDYQSDPSKISTNQSWVAGSMALVSLKSPTVVLFDENKKFHSFGYDAENSYSELVLDNEHHTWFYFKRFKMRLQGKTITRDVVIEDNQGRTMKAVDVFGAVIKFLKEHLLNLLTTRRTEVQNGDIHYVLTVPAIWSDSAKQFMKEAANQAEIDDGQLSIISESEAASLYCQALPSDKMHGSEGVRRAISSPGTKYMVIDMGGLAVTTVYESQADGTPTEIHKAGVSAWGGLKVDEEFYGLLIRVICGPVYQKFVDENKSDHLDLQRELETKKRTITPQSSGKITIKVPVVLLKTFEDETKEDIKEAIEDSPYSGKITWSSDKMRIEAQVFKNLFKPCTDKIVYHIKDLLKAKDVQGTNTFLMVGGFSESVMLQDAIMKALPRGKVIIPEEPGLAVMKGAVLFGLRHV